MDGENDMAGTLTLLLALLQRTRQRGQGLVEYALILVLISIVAITIMTTVGGNINTIFQTASNALVAP
jgi:pilus assembly protein Flp/PilA